MILTEKKPITEIVESLGNAKSVFLLACNGCPEAALTGGEKAISELQEELKKSGKTITGTAIIDFLCNKVLITMRLYRHQAAVNKADAIVINSCGIGVQAASTVSEKSVQPALNTVSMGGFQGLWPSDERCEQCGECVLDSTGGVCPITFCTKSLLNGACGGTKEGKCETDKEKECGWQLIYDRLKKSGQLHKLKKHHKPRNFRKMEPSTEVRTKVFYDIES